MGRILNIKGIGTITIDNLLISDIEESKEGKHFIKFKTKFDNVSTEIGLNTELFINELIDGEWQKSITDEIKEQITEKRISFFKEVIFTLRYNDIYSDLWELADTKVLSYVKGIKMRIENSLASKSDNVYYSDEAIDNSKTTNLSSTNIFHMKNLIDKAWLEFMKEHGQSDE